MKERDKLVSELSLIEKRRSELAQQLNHLYYDEKLSEARQHEGKCFKEVDKNERGYVRCLFVYGTDRTNCNPMAVCVSYWEGKDTYFGIEFYSHFNPEKWEDDDNDRWVEISKDEFNIHYEEAQKRIKLSVFLEKSL